MSSHTFKMEYPLPSIGIIATRARWFDLVIIDEASQSDLLALPSLLRAKKVLVVGDDKQVSPEGVGLEEEKVRSLMNPFLHNQVETIRPQMSPERSIYDLFRVVFATSAVMLKEHFRCVGPIIEYSKREFYNHELCPLRLPKSTERLDPPLTWWLKATTTIG
jgi:superfamily I DNA and/or RNA helicase